MQNSPRPRRYHSVLMLLTLLLLATPVAAFVEPTQGRQVYAKELSQDHQPYAAIVSATGTRVGGTLNRNTTWTRANSPYSIESDVVVARDVTLSIEPGVQVFVNNIRGLQVFGTVVARGTAAAPITFRGSTASPGWWHGITFDGAQPDTALTGSIFEYTTIEHGGRGFGNLYVRYATVSVRNSTIRHSSKDGVYASSGGVVHLQDTTLTNNALYPVHYTDGTVNPDLRRLTVRNNGTNAIALGTGRLTGTHRWENAGAEYIALWDQEIAPGATLVVEPGVTVRFDMVRGLIVRGALRAIGTSASPITFTATTRQPGWWQGIQIEGQPTTPATAAISHAVVEYGGRSGRGNIYVDDGVARIDRSIIRHSSSDGVFVSVGGEGTTISRSQIVQNARAGLNNNEGRSTVVAAHNWWGAASGPVHQPVTGEPNCNPGGTGSRVTARVAFAPFLTGPNQDPGSHTPANAPILSLAPQRWFVPADGVTRANIVITLRDGAGNPLPGRRIALTSSHGTVVDSGPTDFKGEALAYVTTTMPGDAQITARGAGDCSLLLRPVTTVVTFTPFDDGSLIPDAEAPYFSQGITIEKQPVIQGEPNTVSAIVRNPNNFPISVNTTFGYATFGVGQTFGPIAEVQNVVIPANSTGRIAAPWTPRVSGNFCIEMRYAWQRVNAVDGTRNMLKSLFARTNITVRESRPVTQGQRNAFQLAREYTGNIDGTLDAVSFITGPREFIGLFIPDKLFDKVTDNIFDHGGTIIDQLAGVDNNQQNIHQYYYNESRPELKDFDSWWRLRAQSDPHTTLPTYEAYAERVVFPWKPLEPRAGVSPERLRAANAVGKTSMEMRTETRVATIAMRRYIRAVHARDVTWSSRHLASMLYHRRNAAQAMQRWSKALQELVGVMRAEGVENVVLTPAQFELYRDDLRRNGFDEDTIRAARIVGMTDADIEQMRQRRLARPPLEQPVDLLEGILFLADRYQALGASLDRPNDFWGVGDTGAQMRANQSSQLIQTGDQEAVLVVGNPLTETATIDLRVRPLNVPADWLVHVSPITATLQPGQQITATVTLTGGQGDVQGTIPRFAIEGYAGQELIGGVVVDTLLPRREAFDGKSRVYLPLVIR